MTEPQMIKVGSKDQIFSASFMVKDHEEALIGVPIDQDTLRLSFQFLPAEGNEQSALWSVESGIVKFKFKGWRNTLGTSTTEPVKFAEAGNRKIYLQIAHYLMGSDNNLCHAFLYLGAPNE